MKSFLSTFAVCFVLVFGFMGLGGYRILENVWALMAFISLLLAVMIQAFLRQEAKIEALETRMRTLESDGAVDASQD